MASFLNIWIYFSNSLDLSFKQYESRAMEVCKDEHSSN